jgi:hypothetical protein
MFDAALVDMIRAADTADAEDLWLRVALAVALRGTDEPVFGRRSDSEDRGQRFVL